MFRLVPSLVVILVGSSVLAHHSPARFERDQIVAIHGEVISVDWRNPHVYFSVRDTNGLEWLIEANATANLLRSGWKRNSVSVGDVVTARAHANVDPDMTHVMLVSVATGNGEVLQGYVRPVTDSPADTVVSARDLSGTWLGHPGKAFDLLFASMDHPITEKAAAARANFDESMDPAARCVIWPTPRLVAWAAFYPVELEMTADKILFRSEYGKAERVIFTDGREFPRDAERTNQGYSIGTWDGDTLVVETRFLADSISPIAAGIPSGARRRVIERYTLQPDGKTMNIAFEVHDPEYLVGPFEADIVWYYAPDLDIYPFDCDPEVASRFAQ